VPPVGAPEPLDRINGRAHFGSDPGEQAVGSSPARAEQAHRPTAGDQRRCHRDRGDSRR
jgi:hypothetical protein